MKKFLILALTVLSIVSCKGGTSATEALPEIFPDYIGVTVPAGIAPLNFSLVGDWDKVFVEVQGIKAGRLTSSGKYASFNIRKWHRLTEMNAGGEIYFTVLGKKDGRWTQFRTFVIYVSDTPLTDYGVTYRKIAPGYTTFSHIGIYQRNIHNFKESPIIESTLVPGQCIGCHTANRGSADQYMFHARGAHGATLIQRDGRREWLTTKTENTIGNVAYTYWHPSGNYFAGSINPVRQSFWTGKDRWIEVFDLASDIVVMDMRSHELLHSPLLESEMLETEPAFSADGKSLFFCRSKAYEVPRQVDSVRYDLCRIDFDERTGRFGDSVEVIIPAASMGKSITWPRPSYDGRYLMFCVTDFSCFPIDHKEADLWIMDLETGQYRPMDEVNSDYSESYHNWSSDSGWFLFASRRLDGLFGTLWFSTIGPDGRATKPFLLPVKNPSEYYHTTNYSFNVPDFTARKVDFKQRGVYEEVFSDKRTKAIDRL